MSEFDELQHCFKADLDHFLLAILTVRVVDVAGFEKVDGEAAELARFLKGQSLVPKSLRFNLEMKDAAALEKSCRLGYI
jgi:hypothetical protein